VLAEIIEPAVLPQSVCRDPKDDIVLATALSGKADAIVSDDKNLLVLGRYADIPILTARQALGLIEQRLPQR
jgi:predicted nucleic acid-binding protein